MQFRTLLEETLEAWADTRNGVIEEFRNVPASRYDFRPAPQVRSVLELGVHVLEVAMMMTGELTRGDTDFKRAPWPKLLLRYAKPAYAVKKKSELLRLLRAQFRDGRKLFLSAGELHMLQQIERFDGARGTRLAWLQHGIAQEEYHRGQLTIYERVLDIEPALTRRSRGG
jgi:uncharacterized damage-inducible protein DinB